MSKQLEIARMTKGLK